MPLEIYTKLDKDELKVVSALETMGISRCSPIEVKEHLKTCIALSGCQVPTIELFQFLCDFVIKNYGQFKLKELGVAFELYAMGKLSVDKAITFTPKFFGDVMSAYKPIAIQVRQKTEPKEVEQKIEYKINEEEAIKDEIEWWSKGGKDWRIINYNVFDYLWKRKMIHISKEKAEHIKSKVSAYYSTRVETEKDKDNLKDDVFMRIACKRYSLMLYFNKQL